MCIKANQALEKQQDYRKGQQQYYKITTDPPARNCQFFSGNFSFSQQAFFKTN